MSDLWFVTASPIQFFCLASKPHNQEHKRMTTVRSKMFRACGFIVTLSVFSARGGEWVYVFSDDCSLMNCRYCGGISFLKPADRKNFISNIVLRPDLLPSPNSCAEFPLNPRITVHLTAKRWQSILRFYFVAAYEKSASIYLTSHFHYALFSFQSSSTYFFVSSAHDSCNIRYNLLLLPVFMFLRYWRTTTWFLHHFIPLDNWEYLWQYCKLEVFACIYRRPYLFFRPSVCKLVLR